MDRLDEEVYALMSQAHIVVLTGINPYWMSYLRSVLPGLATSQDRGSWDFRYDKEEVCILWAVESCQLVRAEVYLALSIPEGVTRFRRKALRCLFAVGDEHPFHWVIGVQGAKNAAEREARKEAGKNEFKK